MQCLHRRVALKSGMEKAGLNPNIFNAQTMAPGNKTPPTPSPHSENKRKRNISYNWENLIRPQAWQPVPKTCSFALLGKTIVLNNETIDIFGNHKYF